MLNRYFSLAVFVCIAASMAALGQNPGAEYLFQLPNNSSPVFVPYNALANPLNPLPNTAAGPNSINAVVAMPDGSKFYLIGANALQSVDANFQNATGINLTEPSGLVPNITAATLTPNGKYLLVGTTDSNSQSYLFVVNTSTNQATTGSGFPIPLSGQPGPSQLDQTAPCPGCYIVVSRDSTTAYVMENPISGSNTQVIAYSLSTFKQIGAAGSVLLGQGFAGAGNALTLSPQNVLYLAGNNVITMIDPISLLQIGSAIQLAGVNCSALQFTPDGTTAYAINQVPRGPGAPSLLALTIATGSVSYWPTSTASVAPQLTSVFVAGNNNCPSGRCIFAYASPSAIGEPTGTFYDVTPVTGGLGASISTPSPTLDAAIPNPGQRCPGAASIAQCVLAATISNELPSSNYLYVLLYGGNLQRISISTASVSVTNGLPPLLSGSMEFISIPVQGTAASFITFNNVQTVNPGSTSLPLIARGIGGAAGLPVYNTLGTFSVDPTSGLVVNTPNTTTGADGYAQTTISVPATGATCPSGVCTVTYTLGGASTTFTINVPGSGPSGGGGPPGGGSNSPQVIITGGQGQLVQAFSGAAPFPLSIQVTDPTGLPLPNIAVSFAVTSGANGEINPTSTTTDVNGMASTTYFADSIAGGSVSYETDVIVATTSVGSATFFETTYELPSRQNGQETGNGVANDVIAPNAGQAIQVSPGSPAVNAFQSYVTTEPFDGFVSQPIPNVGVTIQDVNNLFNPSPYASCQGNPVSTAQPTMTASGAPLNLQCTVITTCSAPQGLHGITFLVGGRFVVQSSVQINPGAGGNLAIALTSGNNQNGNSGQRAALPLITTVTDFCGNPASNATVTWQVTQGSATLTSPTSNSNTLGQASNTVTFGQTPGAITVTATVAGGASVSFKLTNSVVISGITPVSGGGQTATVGQGFANPLIVSVIDNNRNPVVGLAVTFAVTSGTATVNPSSMNTGTNGQAQTSVIAGAAPGSIVVTASIAGGFSTTFNLTAVPAGPTVTASSFVNAASSVAGLVPCGLGTVTGPGLAPNIQGVMSGLSPFGPLPYTLNNLSLTINGVPAPIEAVANQNGVQQVNFQTPCETAGSSSATVVITISGTPTTIPGVQVFQSQPGIFTSAGPNNLPYGAVIRASDGSYVTPSSLAHRGETYYVIVTGLGQTTPPLTTNSAGIPGENVNTPLIVGINNNGVPVVSAFALQGEQGVYLVGFQIPLTTPASSTAVPLSVAAVVNGVPVYSNSVFLAGIQ